MANALRTLIYNEYGPFVINLIDKYLNGDITYLSLVSEINHTGVRQMDLVDS